MGIAAQTFARDWRTAWNTVLNNYFDGSAHSFGGSGMSFPDCDVVFDRPQLGAHLTKPLIYVSSLSGRTVQRRTADGGGFYKREEIPTVLTVFTADKGDIWADNYNVQDLLEVVLSGAGGDFHALGVRITNVDAAIALNFGPSHDIQATQRIVATQVSVDYPAKG